MKEVCRPQQTWGWTSCYINARSYVFPIYFSKPFFRLKKIFRAVPNAASGSGSLSKWYIKGDTWGCLTVTLSWSTAGNFMTYQLRTWSGDQKCQFLYTYRIQIGKNVWFLFLQDVRSKIIMIIGSWRISTSVISSIHRKQNSSAGNGCTRKWKLF